ncbi:MAG: B3/B4 domain-containing protein, partial [Acidimicrobiia bacterium]
YGPIDSTPSNVVSTRRMSYELAAVKSRIPGCQNGVLVGFRYSDEVIAAFPGTRGGVIHAVGLDNTNSSSSLAERYREEQAKARSELGDGSLSEIPSLGAWRTTFSGFGVRPTQYRNAAEALLRRLTKQGDIPSINLLVDIANLVSIRWRLPVAVFDQAKATGTTSVRFAAGDERFTDLGGDVPTSPEPGEVVFVDETGLVSARRWCWRQSDQSAARPTTVEVLITVEGQHPGAEADVAGATQDLLDLLDEYQPAAGVSSGLLSPSTPEFKPRKQAPPN